MNKEFELVWIWIFKDQSHACVPFIIDRLNLDIIKALLRQKLENSRNQVRSQEGVSED